MQRPLLILRSLQSPISHRTFSTLSIRSAIKSTKQQQSSIPTKSNSKIENVPGQVLMPDISNTSEVGGKGGNGKKENGGIPSEPDNYKKQSRSPSSNSSETITPLQDRDSSRSPNEINSSSSTPKISTAAGLETHFAGGPISGLGGDDVQQGEVGDGRESLKKEDDITLTDRESENDEKKEGGEKRGEEFEFVKRDLNDEERRGLFVLGGILLGGFVLSSFTTPKGKLGHPKE